MGSLTDDKLSKFLIKCLGKYEILFETGTYMGWSAEWAAKYFNNVFTVERSEQIFNETSKRLKHLTNITFLFGHSVDIIDEFADTLPDNVIWWLDSHWSGGITAGYDDECPLLRELEILKGRRNDIILIDDARLFINPPPPPHNPDHWPTLDKIKAKYPMNKIIVDSDIIYIFPNDEVLKIYEDIN